MAERQELELCMVRKVRIGKDVLSHAPQDMATQPCFTGPNPPPKRVFIVSSQPLRQAAESLAARFEGTGFAASLWIGPDGEPTLAQAEEAIRAAQNAGTTCVFGLGGGSAMDMAKLVAALAPTTRTPASVSGIGKVPERLLPLALAPTTAGTGSEVTPIAVLEDEAQQMKLGIVSPHLVPDACYLDPLLTLTLPPSVTAATGIDALTHCIEAFANRHAHPLVDSWALEGVRLIARNLERAVKEPSNLAAREAMLLASHLGGLCLGPVNTAAVHALAYPLGGEFHIPHGVANSLLLPHVLRYTMPAAPQRYAAIAHAMGVTPTNDPVADAEEGIARIEALSAAIGITAKLSAIGISHNHLPQMAASALTVQRLLQNNLRKVSEEDALAIYTAAL